MIKDQTDKLEEYKQRFAEARMQLDESVGRESLKAAVTAGRSSTFAIPAQVAEITSRAEERA